MTLAQIGMAQQSLRRWTDAETHLASALDQATFPWVRKNRPYLEEALETVRLHIGQLAIRGTPGAAVRVNGRHVGNLPLSSPIRVNEGDAEVRVTAAGHSPFIRTVSIQPGATVALEAVLEPVFTAGRQTTGPHPGLGSEIAAGETRWPRGKIAGVALLATSLAALAGGVAFLVADGKGACDRPTGAECVEKYDTSVQGWALVGTGVAAGAVGGLLIYNSSRTKISLGVHGPSLVAVGRF